jgi:uncharacterized protein (TIGR02001 family)
MTRAPAWSGRRGYLKMKALKIALLGAAASLAMGGAAFAQDEPAVDVSFNIGVATDYVFRGVSQTAEDPQIFAGADVTSGIFYGGVWASNVDFLDGTDAEVDVYAGVRPALGPTTLDLGVIYYGYVDAPGGADYDYWELKAAASMPIAQATVGAALYYSPDFTAAGTDEGLYIEVNGAIPLNETFTLSGAVGHQEVEFDGGGDIDYTTWNLGVGIAATENIGVDIRYFDTDAEDLFGSIAEERIVASVKFTL